MYNSSKKQAKPFTFLFPLNNGRVKIGDLEASGTGYAYPNTSVLDDLSERFDCDIDFVKWEGVDIKAVLECEDKRFDSRLMDALREAALEHCADVLFTHQSTAA